MLEIITEACLLFPGWTPETVLKMDALLFFAMLSKGKEISRRWKMRDYAEQCKIAIYPTLIEAHKRELIQFYHDSGMSPNDWRVLDHTRKSMEKKAAQNYANATQALDFFKATSGGAR